MAVHQIRDLLRVIRIERGANLEEFQTQRLDLRAEDLRHREHWHMPAPTHLQRNGDQRMHIAQRAKGGENNRMPGSKLIGRK